MATPQERRDAALARILKALNDALNKPPREGAVPVTAEALTAGAEALAARRPELVEAAQAAAQLAGPAQAPRREVYTLSDAQTFLTDTQRMAEALWSRSTGRRVEGATRDALTAYLVDNLLREERGAPATTIEEIAQQAVETQGAAVREFPERALFSQRLRASADAQLDAGLIDQETFNALVFPATPIADLPARFRGGVTPSLASGRQAEAKALGVISQLESNMPDILRQAVDVGEVADFREAVGKLVAAQTDEDALEGTNLFPAPESPGQIRARERAEGAAELFTKEGNLGRAVEDLLRQSSRAADPSLILDEDDKKAATRAKRMFTEGLKQFRAKILAESPGISEEALAGQLAEFGNTFLESGQYDQLQTAVSEAFEAQEFRNIDLAKKRITEMLGEVGLDAADIPEDIFEGLAFSAVQGGGIDAQNLVNVFPQLQQVGRNLELQEARFDAATPAGAKDLRDQALFDLGEVPQSFSQEQLSAMDQFIAQSGGAESFEREIGPRLQEMKRQNVLGDLPGRFGPGGGGRAGFPTFEQLDALRAEGLGVAPAGNIAALRPGQTQTPSTVRARIGSQLGASGVSSPLMRREEPIEGFDQLESLLREAAGENVPLLSFLFGREQLQGFAPTFRAAQQRSLREERGRFQTIGEDLSGTLRSLRSFPQLTAEAPPGGGVQRAAEEERLRGKIRTASRFQRMARSTVDFPRFAQERIEGLSAEFAQSPTGILEERRRTAQAESEAERDRRRLLRGGGRTVFQRI